VDAIGGTQVTYTVPGSSSIAAICSAVAALSALTGAASAYGFTISSTSTTVVLTNNTAGTLFEVNVQVPASVLRVGETTASLSGGLASDLSACWAENKAWYGLGLDSNSKVEIEEAAAWTETNGSVIFVSHSSDSDVADANVTTDAFSFLKSNSYTRSAGLFTQYSNLSYGGIGWLATRLTQVPGSDTWHFNTIAGVQADTDTLVPEASVLAVQGKNGTVYTTLANLNLTQGGTSGGGEWMDQTRFLDWLRVNIQLAMVALMARNQGKIPFDDSGIAMIEAALKVVLEQGVKNGGFVAGSIVVSPPSVDDIAVSSKTARTLPSMPWTAKLAGAIHRMTVNGVTSVA
jgi:hypothetical protein